MSKRKRYDYLDRLEPKYCGWDPLPRRMMRKRVLRKLVRDALYCDWQISGAHQGEPGKEYVNLIARKLVP